VVRNGKRTGGSAGRMVRPARSHVRA
jgi:hypothetical protein